MHYYCSRTGMSASGGGGGPGAGGPQSCCCGGGGGGGGGGLVNGNGGGEITEARAIGEWESATCDPAGATRSASADSTVTQEQQAARGDSRCCRRSAAPVRGEDPRGFNADGEGGGPRCARGTGSAARRGACHTGDWECRDSEAAVSKRRGCSYSGASKRACFSGTSAAEEAVLHCGGSDPHTGCVRVTPRRPRGAGGVSVTCEVEGAGGVINGERRGCRTAKGRVRLYRMRSFLASTEGTSAAGVPVTPLSHHGQGTPRTQQTPQLSREGGSGKGGSGKGGPAVNGRARAGAAAAGDAPGPGSGQVEAAQVEAKKRQVQLRERTDTLWRRLQAVQVKQVERHVTQQLEDLRRAAVTPSSADIRRLTRSCTEALRTAGGALDSDQTASSSGGGSDSEEEEEEEEEDEEEEEEEEEGRGGRSGCISGDWQWMKERAWLGSRWVWLQAQVSELEYGIRALTELYTHLRQRKVLQFRGVQSVPETPLRAPRHSPAPPDCRFRKRLAEDSAPSSQTPHSPTSSAARVRPLLRQCHHMLIRWEGCSALASKMVTSPCRCEPPAVCVLCGPPQPPAAETSTRTYQKGLDQRIHPVLSMPSDFPLSVHCVMPPLAGRRVHGAVRWMGEATSLYTGRRGQGQHKHGRARRRLICPRLPSTLPLLSTTSGGSNCRSQRGVVSPGLFHQQLADLSHLHSTSAPSDTPTQPLRRRRGESSFDIDNLVMPLGLAGLGARVQKLQYKEIITPSWRERDSVWGNTEHVGSDGACTNHLDTPQQLSRDAQEHKAEVEDVSDAVFLKRHAVWESRERSRWGSWARRRHRGRSEEARRATKRLKRETENNAQKAIMTPELQLLDVSLLSAVKPFPYTFQLPTKILEMILLEVMLQDGDAAYMNLSLTCSCFSAVVNRTQFRQKAHYV
ncbi:KAT8 regulatory NSL complex subunit 1 isoform 3-T3 [Clarias gariepinus]|uniref:uncharacterized protein LOC128518366 isoform X3 n=1 Tax=Clarias gariepinus TaxID=13013 RepID=UPI00234CF90F|nr:uncharacterized protein LOC128518366 isoform X3 [Clarias gariepinus]